MVPPHLAMLVVAAQVLSNLPVPVDSIEAAHAGPAVELGPTAALLFALALLASGFAASGIGTLSGQVVMQDSYGAGSRWSYDDS